LRWARMSCTHEENGSTDWVGTLENPTLSPEMTSREKNDGAGFATILPPVKLHTAYSSHGSTSTRPGPSAAIIWSARSQSLGYCERCTCPQNPHSIVYAYAVATPIASADATQARAELFLLSLRTTASRPTAPNAAYANTTRARNFCGSR